MRSDSSSLMVVNHLTPGPEQGHTLSGLLCRLSSIERVHGARLVPCLCSMSQELRRCQRLCKVQQCYCLIDTVPAHLSSQLASDSRHSTFIDALFKALLCTICLQLCQQ